MINNTVWGLTNSDSADAAPVGVLIGMSLTVASPRLLALLASGSELK